MDWKLSDIIWPVSVIIILWMFRTAIINLLARVSRLTFQGNREGVNVDVCAESRPRADSTPYEQSPASPPQEAANDSQPLGVDGEELTISDVVQQIKTDGIEAAKSSFETLVKKYEGEDIYILMRGYFISKLFSDGNYQYAFNDYKELYDKFTDDDSRNLIIKYWVDCYIKVKQYQKAKEVLSQALGDIKDQNILTQLTCKLAKVFSDSGDQSGARLLLKQRIRLAKSNNEKGKIYDSLSEIEYISGNDVMGALCLQKKFECTPEDSSVMFNTAYQLEKAGIQSISLYNYNTLLDLNPNERGALNNIGLIASDLGLNIKAVEFQIKSCHLDESLACSNVGFALLKAGFVDKAKAMAKKGLEIDPPHDNNHALIDRISKQQQEEDELWKKYVKNSSTHLNNISRYIEAYYTDISEQSCPFVGEWVDSDGIIFIVTEVGGQLSAQWEKRNLSARGFGISGTLSGMIPPPITSDIYPKTVYKLEGNFTNKSAVLRIDISDSTISLLGNSSDSYYRLFSYIDKESNEWIIFNTNLKKSFKTTYKRKIIDD